VLQADAVVIAAGCIPNTKFMEGLDVEKDGSVKVNDYLQSTQCENVYVAGDCATFPKKFCDDTIQTRIEHWDVAMQHGRVAAKNICGKKQAYDTVPFFWTMLWGKSLRYVGHAPEYDDVLVEGDLAKLRFVAYYCKENDIVAVATVGRDPVAIAAAELFKLGIMPTRIQIESGQRNSSDILKQQKFYSDPANAKPIIDNPEKIRKGF